MNKEHVENFSNTIDNDKIRKNSIEKFKEFYAKELRNLQAAEKAFRNLIVLLLRNQDGLEEPKVTSRIKDRDECIKKFFHKYENDTDVIEHTRDIKSRITDLIGLRVTCIYETDIDVVKNRLLSHFEKIGLTNKSEKLEEDDDRFGYKGLHLDLRLNEQRNTLPEYRPFDGVCFEIQVRTIVQDAWSEVDHKLKYKRQIPAKMKRRINRLSALFELADQEFEAIRNMTIERENKAAQQAPDGMLILDDGGKLDSIHTEKIIRSFFPDFNPNPTTVEDFVEEIILAKPSISPKVLRDQIFFNIDTIKNFQESVIEDSGKQLAPYTIIRYCLYLGMPQNFSDLLMKNQVSDYETWSKYKTLNNEEIQRIKREQNIKKSHGLISNNEELDEKIKSPPAQTTTMIN